MELDKSCGLEFKGCSHTDMRNTLIRTCFQKLIYADKIVGVCMSVDYIICI